MSSWADINANKGEASIIFANDIQAELLGTNEYPAPITFNTATEQTIDGNYHNFSSEDAGDAGYYSLSISKASGGLNLVNMGKYSEGDADNNTFSFCFILFYLRLSPIQSNTDQ